MGATTLPVRTFATESVNIVGNGVTVEGNQLYTAGNGQVNVPGTCPVHDATTNQVAKTYGFLQIGTSGADNSGLSVSITNATFHNLPTLAKVEQNASLTITDSSANEIVDFNADCNEAAIEGAQGADVTLARTQIFDSTMPGALKSELGTAAVVSGSGNPCSTTPASRTTTLAGRWRGPAGRRRS